LAAASGGAIEGLIEVERWKFCRATLSHGWWGNSGLELMWTRRTSGRALLAKEREFYIEVDTSEENGVTFWHCKYETDRHGSYCRYSFKTPRPRAFYAQAVAARDESKVIAGHLPKGGVLALESHAGAGGAPRRARMRL